MSDARPKDLELGELPGTELELPPYEATAGSASIVEEEQQAFLRSDPESTAPPVYTGGNAELEGMPAYAVWLMNICGGSFAILLLAVGLGFIFTFLGLFIKLIAVIWKKIGLIN